RCQPSADKPPDDESKGDAHRTEQQSLETDDPPQLPGGGADGLQQAVEPDIASYGDLEHIIDNEVAGEDDEQQHGGNGDHHCGVNIVAKLGAGVAPVDAGVDVVVPGGLTLVAVVFQDLIQVLFNVAGTAF